jgi:cyclase
MKRPLSLIAPSLLVFAVTLAAQQSPPPVQLTQVAGPVYMLSGGGGNIGIVADAAGIVMIDAMEVPSAASIRDAVKALPGGDRVRIVVNTHWHADHTDGNKSFSPGAVVIAHENVRTLLAKDQLLLGRQVKALPAAALPAVTYSDGMKVYTGGEAIRLAHYPRAHTDGDTVVFVDRLKVVHMGDMFFNGMFPFLDVDNGGDIDNWVRQIDAVLARVPADARIIPGHGPLASPADLREFRQILAGSADVVRGQMKEGKTLEQIKAAGLPGRFDPWAKGFLTTPQWLELVYRSLEKQQKP